MHNQSRFRINAQLRALRNGSDPARECSGVVHHSRLFGQANEYLTGLGVRASNLLLRSDQEVSIELQLTNDVGLASRNHAGVSLQLHFPEH